MNRLKTLAAAALLGAVVAAGPGCATLDDCGCDGYTAEYERDIPPPADPDRGAAAGPGPAQPPTQPGVYPDR